MFSPYVLAENLTDECEVDFFHEWANEVLGSIRKNRYLTAFAACVLHAALIEDKDDLSILWEIYVNRERWASWYRARRGVMGHEKYAYDSYSGELFSTFPNSADKSKPFQVVVDLTSWHDAFDTYLSMARRKTM
jgi:hypothetical protein